MTRSDDTARVVAELRRTGVEPSDVEVKAAAGGLSASAVETLSAFGNGSGGTLLLGLDESAGFRPARGFDAATIRDALAHACADRLTPPLRAPVEIVEVDGHLVVRVDVEELDPMEKPCFVTSRGEHGGSYIRGGDGDRRLSRYEVTQLLSSRSQPHHDAELVTRASPDDLDSALVDGFLNRVRARRRQFGQLGQDQLLTDLGVLGVADTGSVHPTIAGLLCFGRYPQKHFPQLYVAVVVLPGLTMGDTSPDGRRFLDNETLEGPVVEIVQAVQHAAIRNMGKGAIVQGFGREDRYDYPLEVIRELVVNAIVHRDYSPEARGAHIQIELYPDRLEVKSPGGLYGPITRSALGTPDQRPLSRNDLLAKILTDVSAPDGRGETLCENRGSGLLAVMRELRRVGMSPPEFRVTPGDVNVVVPQHALLDDDIITWINDLTEPGLTDAQHLALAMMRVSGETSNAMLRTWGVAAGAATTALRDLVTRDLARRTGGRRYARYRLLGAASGGPNAQDLQATLPDPRDPAGVLEAIRAGHVTARAIARATDLSYHAALRRINTLAEEGLVARSGATHSPTQTYLIIEETT